MPGKMGQQSSPHYFNEEGEGRGEGEGGRKPQSFGQRKLSYKRCDENGMPEVRRKLLENIVS